MNQVQKHLLDLVLEIDAFCEDNGLKYYLGGGCLVGAMRNQGFLPWDDDADIHMTRRDAMKLLDISHQGGLPANRAIVSYHDYPDVPLLHWRYVDTTTTVILRSSYTTDVPQGQFIDIFVLNPAPSPSSDRDRFIEDFNLYWDLFSNHVIDSRRTDSVLKRYAFWTKVRKCGGERFMHAYFRKRLFELPEDESDEYSVLGPWVPQPFWDKSLFGEPRRIRFENEEVCVPEKAEEVLCFAYGSNWIDLPRTTERDSHTFVIDFDFPYSLYLHDVDMLMDRHEGGRLSWEWKNEWFSELIDRNHVNRRTRELNLVLFAQELEQQWEKESDSVLDALGNRDYGVVRDFFARYYALQNNENTAYWRLFVPVPDDVLWAAWYGEFMMGDYSRTLKILNRRLVEKDSPLSCVLEKLYRSCEIADSLVKAVWTDKDFEEAEKLIDIGFDEAVPSVVFYRARLACACLGGFEKVDCQAMLDFCCDAMDVYPRDGELSFWRAVLLQKLGRNDEAIGYYRDAAKTLTNGILLTDAKRRLQEDNGNGL